VATEATLAIFLCTTPALLYLTAALRQHSRGKRWSRWRSGSFCFGMLLILYAIFPSHAAHGAHGFTAHMNQHLLIGMLAPTFLVMGAPVSLLLRSLPQAQGKICVRLLHTRLLRIWCHPMTAFGLNFGGMFLLYLTPLYRLSLEHPALHHFIHLHFLLAGYLFAWSLVGPDPTPVRLRMRTRLAILLLAMASHGIFSKQMYIHAFPYDTPHSVDDIRTAAQRMYYGGDFAEVLLAILLFHQYFRRTRRHPASHRALALAN
jgi:putative membrane protein